MTCATCTQGAQIDPSKSNVAIGTGFGISGAGVA